MTQLAFLGLVPPKVVLHRGTPQPKTSSMLALAILLGYLHIERKGQMLSWDIYLGDLIFSLSILGLYLCGQALLKIQ